MTYEQAMEEAVHNGKAVKRHHWVTTSVKFDPSIKCMLFSGGMDHGNHYSPMYDDQSATDWETVIVSMINQLALFAFIVLPLNVIAVLVVVALVNWLS